MIKVEIVEGRILRPYKQSQISGVFELTPYKKRRSNGQNGYLHKILFPMIAEGMTKKTGKDITAEFAKEILKYKFLQRFTDAGTVVMPTSKLSTVECMEFIENCQRYGADVLSIDVPSPNEQDYSKIN